MGKRSTKYLSAVLALLMMMPVTSCVKKDNDPEPSVSNSGEEVDPDDVFDGDIICFDRDGDGVMEHCGMYVGNDIYVHVLPDKGVVASCYSDVKSEIGTIRRVVLYPELIW